MKVDMLARAVCLISQSKIFQSSSRYGKLKEVVKFPEASYAFVTFAIEAAAAAAMEALKNRPVSLGLSPIPLVQELVKELV